MTASTTTHENEVTLEDTTFIGNYSDTETIQTSSKLPSEESYNMLMLYAYGTMGFLTIIGNATIIMMFLRIEKVRKVLANIYIFYLAIADLNVGVSIMMATSIWGLLNFFPLTIVICDFWLVLRYFGVLMSSLVITLMSCDRYFLVAAPFKYHSTQTPGKIHRFVLISTALCFLYCFFVIYIGKLFTSTTNHNEGENVHDCDVEMEPHPIYFLISTSLNVVLPSVVLVAVNVAFFWKLKQRINNISKMTSPPRLVERLAQSTENDFVDPSCRRAENTDQKVTCETSANDPRNNGNGSRDEIGKSLEDVRVIVSGCVRYFSENKAETEKRLKPEESENALVDGNHILQLKTSTENNSRIEGTDTLYKPGQCYKTMNGEYFANSQNVPCYGDTNRKTIAIFQDDGIKEAFMTREKAKLRRIARKLGTYVTIFFICWLPYEILSCVSIFNFEPPPIAFNVVGFLVSINSLINPLLYPAFRHRNGK
ncbi:Octopamine receptor [Holothuria leucospilota]|uniref:Octopamine receptor n=1 Tax=Holothuria leucospilota TaxID=206669 RepID=A0A9Q1HAW5_HOLLE|nr:Octopamine receptor [Holothuria leucospilota]